MLVRIEPLKSFIAARSLLRFYRHDNYSDAAGLDTPVTAAFVTPSNISVFSGQDTGLAVQGDVQITAGHTLSSVSGQTTSLYTHAGGIKAITANGGLSLRAHTDAQQIWADQGITVQSTTDEIRIQASESITLSAGQSAIVIKGGDITFTCPGNWTVKGATHDWGAGGGGGASLMALPSGVQARVPEPSLAPSLESPIYSEALGFGAYPNEWLPFSGMKSVVVFDGTQTVGYLSAAPTDEFTASLITEAPKPVRYELSLASGWAIEQDIQIAEPDSGTWIERESGEEADND